MNENTLKVLNSIGLLLLRVGAGTMLALGHGWQKAATFSDKMDSFPDPLGVGHTMRLILAIFGELVCGLLVAVGAATRAACIPAIVTMLVAALFIHADDPWARKEFALIYAVPFIALFFTGPGSFSIDELLFKSKKKAR